MKVGFLITARLKSTRLPKKIIREVQGRPLLGHMIDRLKASRRINEIVICTSTNLQDDPLEDLAADEGVQCFRGHEEDVIRRLHDASQHFGFDYVLNITADCPLVDPWYADRVVDAYQETEADLIRALDLPHGAYSYGIKPQALTKVVEIKDDDHTEVWGRYFTDTDLFHVYDLPITDTNHRWPDLRMTLDYPEDLEFFEAVCAALYEPGKVFTLDQILSYLRAHPEVVAINSHCADAFRRRLAKQAGIQLKPRYDVRSAVVVGAGSIGQRHIRNLRALGITDIVALRTRRGHFQELDPSLGVREVISWEEIKKAAPDVAIISNPTALHVEAVNELLPTVRGIFIEKPVSNSMENLDCILQEIVDRRIVTFMGYPLQFHPIVTTTRAALSDGHFGNPLCYQGVVGHWLPDWHPWEDYATSYTARRDLGGGVALTLIHEIQMAIGWFGPVLSVTGKFPRNLLLSLEVDVNADLMLQHQQGSISQLHLDFIQRPWHREGIISCERGWIRYDFGNLSIIAQCDGDDDNAVLWHDQNYDQNDCFTEMMATFLRFVREGRVRHELDIWSGAEGMAVVLAAFESSRTSAWEKPVLVK